MKKYLVAFLIFAGFAFLYIYTAPRGVYDGDSGEMAMMVHTLGLAHSTGFPLYILSGKLFTLIFPFGDVAFRLNVYSGLLTALAISLFFLMLLDLELSAFTSFLAATIFGLGSSIWSNAGVARVYPLAMLFMVVLLWIFIRWQKEHKISYIYWYAFMWGLSFGTHLLMLVMLWPFAFMLWAQREQLAKRPKIMWKALSLFVAPFIQYLYIPIAYARHVNFSEGRITTLGDFVSYITQRQYTFKMFDRSWDGTLAFFAKIFSLLSSELSIFFFVLSLVGLILLYRKNKMFLGVLLLMSASNIAIMLAYGNASDLYILHRYVLAAYLTLAIGVAYCIAALRKIDSTKWFFAAVIVLFIFAEFQAGYAQNNRRDNFLVDDTARNVVQGVQANSIVFIISDSVFGPLLYLQGYGYRSDVVVVEPELLSVDWYVKNLIEQYPTIFSPTLLAIQGDTLRRDSLRTRQVVEDNIGKRDIYAMFSDFLLPDNKTLADDFTITPFGLLNKITAKGSDPRSIILKNDDMWSTYQLRMLTTGAYRGTMEDDLSILYSGALYNLGITYFNEGFASQAVDALRWSLKINSTSYAQNELDFVESHH